MSEAKKTTTSSYVNIASNPGSPFRILSRRFFSKAARQNPERIAWVRGYYVNLPHRRAGPLFLVM